MMRLAQRLIRPGESPSDQPVRKRLGTFASAVGIGTNILLSLTKVIIGTLTGSLAVTADAVNNLSDAAGSIVSLISVRVAQKPIDREHPFGHGRIEYLGALGVGALILVMGLELLKSGVSGIITPQAMHFAWVPFLILLFSIAVKGALFFFYRDVGRLIDADSLKAASRDSLSDVLATSAVALSMVIGQFTAFPVDGVMSIIVALLVLKTGFEVVRDQMDTLMGAKTNPELGRQIIAMLNQYDEILGTHDLTGHGHGTDCALIAGLLGMQPDDLRIPGSFAVAAEQGLTFSFRNVQLRNAHPNTARLQLTGAKGRTLDIVAESIGGGRIRIRSIDGIETNFSGEHNTLIVHNQDTPGHVAAVTAALMQRHVNIATMQLYRSEQGGYAVMILECDQPIPKDIEQWLSHIEGIQKITIFNQEEPV